MEVINIARALLESYPLCDHCLGRQFAMLGHGLTNRERGNSFKLLLIIEGNRLIIDGDEFGRRILESVAVNGFSIMAFKTLESQGLKIDEKKRVCQICKGAFESIEELAQKVVERLSEYEYETFLIGVRIPNEAEEREDELRSRFNIRWGENIRNEFNREIGKRVAELVGKNVEHKGPDIIAIVNPFIGQIRVEVNPIFVAGRYRKLVRGIPQGKWICSKCRGKGCDECAHTGKKYPDSIEELVATKIEGGFKGADVKLHAAGREDVEMRVLGSGRPFVVEVKKPKIRRIDLKLLEDEINNDAKGKVEVVDLKFTSRETARKLKESQSVKVFRALVEFGREISDEDLSLLKESFEDKEITQKNSLRMMRRQDAKFQKKYLYGMELKRLKSNLVEILVRCQGGLYIKELISGDAGRTNPSVAEVLKTSAECTELDIMDVCLEID